MTIPYRARVDERLFLNLPGFHGGAYVVAYVEDTRKRGLDRCDCGRNCHEPRRTSSPGRSSRSLTATAGSSSSARCTRSPRANSLHKLDTLIAALRVFRKGLEEEFAEYDRREAELKELKGE